VSCLLKTASPCILPELALRLFDVDKSIYKKNFDTILSIKKKL